MVIFLIVWYFISGAASNLNFDFAKVYEYREQNASLTDSGVLSYINVWIYKVFSVFLMSHFLLKKKHSYFVLVCLVQVFFFAVSAHKAVLFFPFLVVGIYIIFAKAKTKNLVIIPLVYTSIVFCSYFLAALFDYNLIASMLIRRLFIVPAVTTYEFFYLAYDHGYIFWSNSVLSFLSDYPFDKSLSLVVGDRILGDSASYKALGANNGFISMGYVHGGLIGVTVYSLIFGVILKLFDSLSRSGIPVWLILSVSIVPIRDLLISSDLFTVLLTHGLLVTFILLMFYRNKSYVLEKDN
jgi:hypothetical protein